MKKIFLIYALMAGMVLSACDSDQDPGGNSLVLMSNEWWAQIYVPDGNGGLIDIGEGYQHLLTSNTASASADSLFVDDFDGLLELKAKVACDAGTLTFHNDDEPVEERYTGGWVVINNGKILQNKGKSTSGVVVDSIYFEAEFDWDPGQVYVLAGHARTGFAEDEH